MKSLEKKIRGVDKGKPLPELTRFKFLWRDSLTEAQKDYWRSRFVSESTQASIRAELKLKLGIDLLYDDQLKAFRAWDEEQEFRDSEAERMLEDERRFKEANPDLSEEELRSKVLLAYYQRALSRGETGLGKAMMKQDLAERRFQFDREMALEAKKSEQQKALEYCLAEAKQFPEVQELFKQAFAALKKARSK